MKKSTKDIQTEFSKKIKSEKIEILFEAIDNMQEYNGRSKLTCIAIAMGYDFDGVGGYSKPETNLIQ